MGGPGQKWVWSFHETPKSAEWFYGLSWFFCMLTVMQWFFIRPRSHFLPLTFKCQSVAVVVVSSLSVAGRTLWNRVCQSFPPDICQSFPPDICQDVFLEFDSEISLNFPMVLETRMKLCIRAQFFGKTFLLQKLGKWGKNMFNLKKKLVIIFTEFVL